MHNFTMMLLTCSAVMSLIALIYMAINPLLARRYSEKGRYYVWLIILAGLIIPFRPQWSNAIIRVDIPNETAPILQIGNEQTGNLLSSIYLPLSTEPAPFASITQNITLTWWQIAFFVWLVGLITFLGFHAVNHYFFMQRVKRWSSDISDEKSNILFESLKTEMGITNPIRLVMCEGIGSPMMLGFVKPTILLPTANLAKDELRFILQHELVHYKRKDLFYKCLVLIATAIHWFNPVIYMIAKAINAQCELSCDAEIVQSADDDTRQQYSETIIGVIRYQSRFKTALSTTFYGGRKGMKNRIASIMTTGKKKATLGSMALALALISALTIGTLTAFAAELPQPEPEIGRPMRNIGRRISGEIVLNPEWEEKLQNGEIAFYELDQITPFDFSRTISERIADGQTIFRIDGTGRLSERLDMPELRLGMTLEELQELGFNVQLIPTTQHIFSTPSYEFMRERGKTPIIGANDTILMWVDQSFFDMTYEEFNELAEQLLTTAVIIQTQETVDILREHWLAAQ